MLPVFAESGSWGLVRLDGDEVSTVVENQALQRVQEEAEAVDARTYVRYNSIRKSSHRCSSHRWLPAPTQTVICAGASFVFGRMLHPAFSIVNAPTAGRTAG